jgi:hypothetical protein
LIWSWSLLKLRIENYGAVPRSQVARSSRHLSWIEVWSVGASQGVRKRASSRAGARRRLLIAINKGGSTCGESQCATRLGNIALEARISRSEVGCGELRCPAMALGPGLPVHQPRLLGSESEAAYRRRPLLRCAGLSRLTGILSPNSPLMYFPSSAASGGSSACGASKGVGNLPIRRGKPDASRGWTVRATRKVAGPPGGVSAARMRWRAAGSNLTRSNLRWNARNWA